METIIYEGLNYKKPDNHERDLYRSKTARAIKLGKLKKQVCEICGDTEVHAHHEIYSNYLNVRWLCPIHHKAIHSIFNAINKLENNIAIYNEITKQGKRSYFWVIAAESDMSKLNDLIERYILPGLQVEKKEIKIEEE